MIVQMHLVGRALTALKLLLFVITEIIRGRCVSNTFVDYVASMKSKR